MAKKLSASSHREKRTKKKGISTADLSTNQRKALERIAKKSDREIDYSDLSELEFDKMGRPVVGKFYRPLKKSISLRMDIDVLDWFKANSCHYQRLINKACRLYMEQRKH